MISFCPSSRGPDAEPLEAEQRAAEVVAPDAVDGEGAVRDGGQADEGADLDVVGADRVGGAVERLSPVDHVGVGADPLDPGAHRHQEPGEVLHVRLRGGVPEDGAPLRPHRRHQRVLGAGDARLVEEDVGPAERLAEELVAVAELHLGAERLEGEEVGVHPAPPDDVAAGGRQRHPAEPGQERAREQDRGADPGAEPRIERLVLDGARVDPDVVGVEPLDPGAQFREDGEHGLHVADARHVVQLDGALGQDGGGDGGERGVLVAGGAHGAAERVSAADEIAWRHGQSSPGVRGAVKREGFRIAPGGGILRG